MDFSVFANINKEWFQWGGRILSAILVIALAKLLANMTWLVISGPEELISPLMISSLPGEKSDIKLVHFTQAEFERWNIFGKFEEKKALPVSNEPIEAPETKLRLELLGVMQAEAEKDSSAIISEKGKSGELFKIGDQLPGNATLKTVYADRVLLDRRGQLETLRFDDDYNDAIATEVKSQNRRKRSSRLEKMVGKGGVNLQSIARVIEQDLDAGSEMLIREMGLQALMENGQPAGYKVSSGASSGMLKKIGLRPGDVVTSVNGHPLGDIQQDKNLIKDIRAQGEAKVEVRRGSQIFTVNVPL